MHRVNGVRGIRVWGYNNNNNRNGEKNEGSKCVIHKIYYTKHFVKCRNSERGQRTKWQTHQKKSHFHWNYRKPFHIFRQTRNILFRQNIIDSLEVSKFREKSGCVISFVLKPRIECRKRSGNMTYTIFTSTKFIQAIYFTTLFCEYCLEKYARRTCTNKLYHWMLNRKNLDAEPFQSERG